MTEWFLKKFIVIEDLYITGDEVIDVICEATPPGFHNRIHGIQNIKGIGLKIVHCFQSWSTCYKICRELYDDHSSDFEKNFTALINFKAYNLLCEEFVRETIQKISNLPALQQERFQAELILIQSNLDNNLAQIRGKMNMISKSPLWLEKVIRSIEAFLDIGDAVKRRKKANQIYEDLSTMRISYSTAIRELQLLNDRQEDGWLYIQLRQIFNDYGIKS